MCFCFLLQMQEVQQSKEKTLANNRILAEQNLALQPRLEEKKEQLTKRYGCLQEGFESYQLRKSALGAATVCSQHTDTIVYWPLCQRVFNFSCYWVLQKFEYSCP